MHGRVTVDTGDNSAALTLLAANGWNATLADGGRVRIDDPDATEHPDIIAECLVARGLRPAPLVGG